MPTYLDITRTSTQSCAFAFSTKVRLWDLSYAKPPGTYEYESKVDFTVGGHYGCSARLQVIYITTGSAPVPGPAGTPWNWQIIARVTVNNGHGATNTQDVVIDSGSIPYGGVRFVDKTGSFSGSFSFSCPSGIFYDITESQPDPSTKYFPPYTNIKQYERSTVGGTASCSMTVNGTATTASGTISTAKATTYNFDCTASNICVGSLAGVCDLLISAPLTNSIAIPSYSYLQYSSAANFVSQGGTIELKNTGTDDAFGDPQTNSNSLTSSVCKDRKLKMIGKANAFDITYPNSLSWIITGFDTTSRTITATGNFDEIYTQDKYSFASNITLAGSSTNQSSALNTFKNLLKSNIVASSLTANNDDNQAITRMRAWNFAGANMYLADEYQVIGGGTGNLRSFSPYKNLNSYRYMDLEVKSLSGTQSDNVSVLTAPTDTRIWPFTTSSTTYEYKRFDLCSPPNKTSSIDNQDDPYPRLNETYPSHFPAQERINQDYFGLNRTSDIGITNANIQLNRIYMRKNADTAKSTFVFPQDYGMTANCWKKIFTDQNPGGVTTSFYGRRLWQQDVEGKVEEEYDVYYTISGGTTTYFPLTISQFASNVQNRHIGWSCTPSTALGTGLAAYLNSTTGYASWLGGITFKADTGGGTIIKDWINVEQDAGKADADVLAQVIFDEFNTSELVADYGDPFGIWKNPSYPLITIATYGIFRGCSHGLLLNNDATPMLAGVTNLYLTSSGANRGSGVSIANGTYQTGSPKSLGNQNHHIDYLTLSQNNNPMISAKRQRTSFKNPTAITADILSADISNIYQHLIGYVDSGTVKLWITITPTFTAPIIITTNITGASNVAVRWKNNTKSNEIILDVQDTTGTIKKYILDSLSTGVATLATTLGTGTSPALAIDKNGVEYHFFRTTDAGGSIKRVAMDSTGRVIIASSIVVSGNVADKGLAAYCRNNDIYLVYSHTTTGITIVRSYDLSNTFS